MKNMKSNIVKVIGLSLMAIILFAILACKVEPEPFEPMEFNAKLSAEDNNIIIVTLGAGGTEVMRKRIEELLDVAFNDRPGGVGGPAHANRFRNVFGPAINADGVTIHIVGPEAAFKLQVETQDTMRFNVDYLSSSTIQQSIVDAVNYIHSNANTDNFPHTIAP